MIRTWRDIPRGLPCVFACGEDATTTAYGQPVCRAHDARCLAISNAERTEWVMRQGGKVPVLIPVCDVKCVA